MIITPTSNGYLCQPTEKVELDALVQYLQGQDQKPVVPGSAEAAFQKSIKIPPILNTLPSK